MAISRQDFFNDLLSDLKQHNDPTLRDLARTIEAQRTSHNVFSYMLNAMAYIGNYASVAVDVAEAQRVALLDSRNIFFTEGWWQRKLSEFQLYSNAELEDKPNAGELVESDGDLVYSEIDRSKQRIVLASIATNTRTVKTDEDNPLKQIIRIKETTVATFYALQSDDDKLSSIYPTKLKPFPLTNAEKTQLTRYITQIIPFGLSFELGVLGYNTTETSLTDPTRMHVAIFSRDTSSTSEVDDTKTIEYLNSVYASPEEAMAAVQRQLDTFRDNNQLSYVSGDDLFCEIGKVRGIASIGNLNLAYHSIDKDGTAILRQITTSPTHKKLISPNIYWTYSLGSSLASATLVLDFKGIDR